MWNVFISHKSEDYEHAKLVYDFLTARGFSVFLSELSITQAGRADYQDTIEEALDVCEHMVLVSSKREFVEATWVKAEWRVFLHELRSGNKQGNLITLLADGLPPGDLPIGLRNLQSLPLSNNGLEELIGFIGADESPSRASSTNRAPSAASASSVAPSSSTQLATTHNEEAEERVQSFLLQLKTSPMLKGENMWVIGLLTLGLNHVFAGRQIVSMTLGLLSELVSEQQPPRLGKMVSRFFYCAGVLMYAVGIGLLGAYGLRRLMDNTLDSFIADKDILVLSTMLLCAGVVLFLFWLWHTLRAIDIWKAGKDIAPQLPPVWRPTPEKLIFYSACFSKIIIFSVIYASNVFFVSKIYEQFLIEFSSADISSLLALFFMILAYAYLTFASGHFIMYEMLWKFLDENYASHSSRTFTSIKNKISSPSIWLHLMANIMLNALTTVMIVNSALLFA